MKRLPDSELEIMMIIWDLDKLPNVLLMLFLLLQFISISRVPFFSR